MIGLLQFNLQFTFFAPLDVWTGLVLYRSLEFVFAKGDGDVAVVGAISSFDQQTLGLVNCAEKIDKDSDKIIKKIIDILLQ